jgi:hypothetical protein
VQFYPDLSGVSQRSFALYSSTNQFIGGLFFSVSGISDTVNITTDNGTVLVTNGTTDGKRWFTIVATVSSSSVTWKVYNGLGSLLGTAVMTPGAFADVSEAVFDESATADGTTSVDNVAFSAMKQVSYPAYIFFDTLSQNSVVPDWKSFKVPINNRTYGAYEAYLWGTDATLGLNYYVAPDYETFTYDSSTPVLTDADVANALAQLNTVQGTAGVVTGDLATDLLPRVWNAIGLKTTGSKMIGGLVLLIATIYMLSGLGEAVMILVVCIEGIVFAIPQVGLFPVWFIIIEVVIAAALIAVAIRKQTSG